MALAASSVVSTAAVGAVVLGIAALAVRNIWKKKTQGVSGQEGKENRVLTR